MSQRQKQIEIGYNTPEYANYIGQVRMSRRANGPLARPGGPVGPPPPCLPLLSKAATGHARCTGTWTQVPKHSRDPRDKKRHPRTPDPTVKRSKRAFDGLIKQWRRLLHEFWDPSLGPAEEAVEPAGPGGEGGTGRGRKRGREEGEGEGGWERRKRDAGESD